MFRSSNSHKRRPFHSFVFWLGHSSAKNVCTMSGLSSGSVRNAWSSVLYMFHLPLPSNVLFLTFTNVSGPTMSGNVDIVTSRSQPHNVATVWVVVHYNGENVRESFKVHMVHRGEGENGVDVYVSDWVHQQHDAKLSFEMKVILPEPSDSPLIIKRFETDVGSVAQKVRDLKDKVLFQSLYLKGTDGDIYVESLKADQGRIETTNGAIHRHFHTFGELNLSTSDGKIQTDVGLRSLGRSKVKVTMDSTNGDIETNINLSTSNGSGGSFEASTTSQNGNVDVKFPMSPLDSKLKFVGENKNGDIKFSLNPAYGGTVSLKSSESTPTVDKHERKDSSGKNRKRVVSLHTEKYSVSGQVYWEESNAGLGTVDARTKYSSVVLTL